MSPGFGVVGFSCVETVALANAGEVRSHRRIFPLKSILIGENYQIRLREIARMVQATTAIGMMVFNNLSGAALYSIRPFSLSCL